MNLSPHHPRLTPKRRPPRAAAATEYIAILALVVIPLAIMINTTVLWTGNGTQSGDTLVRQNLSPKPPERPRLLPAYEHRITSTIILPIG